MTMTKDELNIINGRIDAISILIGKLSRFSNLAINDFKINTYSNDGIDQTDIVQDMTEQQILDLLVKIKLLSAQLKTEAIAIDNYLQAQ